MPREERYIKAKFLVLFHSKHDFGCFFQHWRLDESLLACDKSCNNIHELIIAAVYVQVVALIFQLS